MKNVFLILALLFAVTTVSAQETTDPSDTLTVEEFEAQLQYQQGQIILKDSLAVLNVPAEFRYLNPEQTERVIVAWGNPPGNETLGMLVPSDLGPLQEDGWGVIITYDEDGYVKDDEAEKINYTELLEQMQEDTKTANAERTKLGYESVGLIGWATPPHYDPASHKLYWAKELQFGESPVHTLNYNIRALGRRGVLVINAVSSMPQLQMIEGKMQTVLAFVEFNPGHRYTDFNPGLDKVAAYGIGALIAGKIAAKAGLLKLLLAFLVAGKKFAVLLLIGLGAFLKKLYAKISGSESLPTRLQ